MIQISTTDLRQNIFKTFDKVIDDREHVVIKRKNENVIMLPENEYNSIMETIHLFSSPANAKRLLESFKEVDQGKSIETTIDALKDKFNVEDSD